METHKAIFRWVLRIDQRADDPDRRRHTGSQCGLKSIVGRDNGQSYNDYLKGLAQAAGIENPTREQLARLDRKRKKEGSNQEWMSPSDPDARITKMKDGRTHLAHKAEHGMDLTSGALEERPPLHRHCRTPVNRLWYIVAEPVPPKNGHQDGHQTQAGHRRFLDRIWCPFCCPFFD